MVGHRWDTGIVTTEPTCTTPDVKTYTCGFGCGTTRTEEIDALGHDWGEPTYTWSDDMSSVTATRVCKRDAAHVETETAQTTEAVAKPATCEQAGTRTYTATFENAAFEAQSKEAEIPALDHTPGSPVRENEVAATDTAEGSYDEVVYCTICGEELSRVKKTVPKLDVTYFATEGDGGS